ncbi:MAG TPA: nitrate/sulfonate/bicarbonate ABC transporter ATP-binding protein [Alphaproteobacteria bacterium]|nr:nitrate/sulfonate/bicarbonate ABC transporter ATP-binding protein [Alphaproteobacteria bacterium]
MVDNSALIEVEHLFKTYPVADHGDRLVLEDINFRMVPNEIVAVLGKSGSGKSTFLRILAGLSEPSQGEVRYRGRPVHGPVQGAGMVFQSFALFPWLTVLGNVELGLEAQNIPREERRKRAIAAIDLIGLDGFESAYPKELSGGMRQRVGFARALVINPDVLLLDEPFSALDVLTAETLRGDLVDLWLDRKIPTQSILMVSHNIEESVEMADRILIFSSDPGRIRAQIAVPLPRPRDWNSPGFRHIVDQVYTILTTTPGGTAHKRARGEPGVEGQEFTMPLPDAPTQQISAIIDTLMEDRYRGRADLPDLAEYQNLSMDDLFVLLDGMQLLGLAHVAGGDIELTAIGRAFSEAEIDERKRIFGEALLRNVPLAAHIVKVLKERPNHRAPASRFLNELEDHMSEEEAGVTLDRLITWARYAELFAYDYDTQTLRLEDEEAREAAE